MVQVLSTSPEAKLLKVLIVRYPVDEHELSERTGLDVKEVRRVLNGMEARGWVKLDRLPDRTFVRLLRVDFTFIGRDETQRKAVKHKKGRKDRTVRERLLRDEHDDIMYA
jgi:transcription initiation factor IIE alpha subunit